MQLPCPLTAAGEPLSQTNCLGFKDGLLPQEHRRLWGQPGSRHHPHTRDMLRNTGRQACVEHANQALSHPLPSLRHKSRKQGAGSSSWVPSDRPPTGARALYSRKAGKGPFRNSLPGQVAPAAGLEPDNDVCDLQVPLLLQVGQHAGPEEDLALADAVQIAVQLQGFDLDGSRAMHHTAETHRTSTLMAPKGLPSFHLPPPRSAITSYKCPAGPPSTQRWLSVITVTTRTRSSSGQAQDQMLIR